MSEQFSRATKTRVWSGQPATTLLQLALVVCSNWLAFLLRFDWALPPPAAAAFWQALPWLVAIRAGTFIAFRLNEGLWRYAGIYDLRAIVVAVFVSSFGFFLSALTPFGPPVYPLSIVIVDAVLLTWMLGAIRLSRRVA